MLIFQKRYLKLNQTYMLATLNFRISHLLIENDTRPVSVSNVHIRTDLPELVAQVLINDPSRVIEIEYYTPVFTPLPIKLNDPPFICKGGNYELQLTIEEEDRDLIPSSLSEPKNQRDSKRQRLRDDIKFWKDHLSRTFGKENVKISWDYGLKP